MLSPAEAVRLLTHVVARNGNLLLNIGPTAGGEVPAVYQPTIDALSDWMAVHGDAVRGTRPCTWWGAPTDSYGVVQRDGVVYAYVMDPLGRCDVPFPDGTRLHTLDGRVVPYSAGRAELPVDQRELPVAVVRVQLS